MTIGQWSKFMAHSYTKILIHYVFSTKNREKIMTAPLQERLWAYMGGIAKGTSGMHRRAATKLRPAILRNHFRTNIFRFWKNMLLIMINVMSGNSIVPTGLNLVVFFPGNKLPVWVGTSLRD